MKRSRLHRGLAFAVVLPMAASACSFRPPNDVSIKAVPIDLKFGADIPDEVTPQTPGLGRQPPPAVLELPPIELPPRIDFDDGPLCPPLSTFAARDVSPPNVQVVPKPAEPGEESFLYRWDGRLVDAAGKTLKDRTGKKEGPFVGYKRISNVEPNRSHHGFFFDIEDAFVGHMMSFTVIPLTSGEKDHGIYFKRVVWPATDKTRGRIEFIPSRPSDAPPEFDPNNPPPNPEDYAGEQAATVTYGLKMSTFPLKPGTSFVQQAENTAFNMPTGRNDPTGAPIFRPAVMTITSTVEVGDKDIIEVCDQLAQGWRINWTLQAEGEYAWTMIGTFWLGTQYGGLPIKEEYLLITDGQTIAGNVSSNLMKLDPGIYL